MNNYNTNRNSTDSSTSGTAFDSSFRLELVNLPVWWHHHSEQQAKVPTNSSLFGSDGLALQKLPWAAAVIEELRKTDNILVTEIGERGLLEYLQDGLMTTRCDESDRAGDDEDDEPPLPCDWELQDEASFRYIMEILQANMIYFMKRRYFDLERCRETPNESKSNSNSIAQDFSIVFDKASSSRYLTSRERVAHICFQRPYQQKRKHNGICPKTIKSALVRLHRRAGIYLPEPVNGRSYHPGSVENNALENGVDAYWIDLWWICSSLLSWILEPCLEITRSVENADHYLCPQKRRKMMQNSSDPTGFLKQRLIKIPFSLIRSHTQTLGLYYDKVLLHDGPWDEDEDDDYVIYNSNNNNSSSSSNSNNDPESDDDDGYSDESSQDKGDEAAIAANILVEANRWNETTPTAEVNLQHQGWGNGTMETLKTPYVVNQQQQSGQGQKGNGENHPTQMVDSNEINNDYEARDEAINEVYDSFWANKNENLDGLGSGVFQV